MPREQESLGHSKALDRAVWVAMPGAHPVTLAGTPLCTRELQSVETFPSDRKRQNMEFGRL